MNVRGLLSLIFVFLLCAPIYAQFEAEFFKVGEELIVREEAAFSWQNQNDLVYLGSLKRIPGNRPIPSLKEREEVMNVLLNQFLASAIDQAQVRQEDTVFRDGFVLDQELTAVAIQYEEDGSYEVEVALRLVETEEEGELPMTFTDLMTRLLDYLNEVQGPGHTLSKIGIEENSYYVKYDTETHVIRKDGRTYFEIDVITQENAFTENFDEFATHQGYEGGDELILDMFLPNSPLKEWRNDLSGPNDKYLRVYQNELTRPSEEIVKGLLGTVTSVSIATKSLSIDSLQRAREWGQYDFITDFIRREVQYPDPDRDILYLSPRDPIFVQDSVLDIYVDRRFQNVSSQPIPVSLRQWVLPELLHRWEREKPLRIAGTVQSVSPNVVSYQFDGEDFSVVVQPNKKGDELRFRYILGWEQVEEKQGLLSLLSRFDLPEREAITIRQVGDHVLLVRPNHLGELLVDLWQPDTGTRRGLGKLPSALSVQQRDLALEVIVNRFEAHPADCSPNFPKAVEYEDNQLMVTFTDKDRLYLYERLSADETRMLTIAGGRNIDNEVPFYQALLAQDSLQGELSIVDNEGIPIVGDCSGTFWFRVNDRITLLADLQKPDPDLEKWGEVLSQLVMAYPERREAATIMHLASDLTYAAVNYEKQNVSGIVSVANPLSSILLIDHFFDFASNEKLSEEIVEQCLREGVYQNLSIYGAAEDPSWIVKVGQRYFLASERLEQLMSLGASYQLNDVQRRAFLNYLTDIALSTKDMTMTMMEVKPSYRILGLRAEPDQARIFFSDGRDMKLSGSLNQSIYFVEEDFQQQLISTFSTATQVFTEEISGILISEAPGRLAVWNKAAKVFHEPSDNVPQYRADQRSRILAEVLRDFKSDETVKLEFRSDISTVNAYGIHNPANATWSYVAANGDQLVRMRKEDAGQTIGKDVVDEVLKQETIGTVHTYSYVSNRNIPFLRDSQNTLVRLKDTGGNISWTELANLGDLDRVSSPQLYDELLDYLSEYTALQFLEDFSFLHLNVHDVVAWKKRSTFTTISHNKVNGLRSRFEQRHYRELLSDTVLLDRYFEEEASLETSKEVEVCVQQNEFASIYNPERQLWVISREGKILKEFTLYNEVFTDIKTTRSLQTRLYLIRALLKLDNPNPDIHYSDKGFFFYNNGRVIYYLGVFMPGSVWSSRITQIDRELDNDIGVNKVSRFKTSDNEKIINLIFTASALKGQNYIDVFSLRGKEPLEFKERKVKL